MRISDWSSDVCSSDLAIDSGTVTLVAVDDVDPVSFGSTGSGGMGGDGGGSGGSGGNGIGGTVRLIANGGTIGSDGHPVEIVRSEEGRVGKEGVVTCRLRG